MRERLQRERTAVANDMIASIFASVPQGSTLMIGLDDDMEPYATIDGRKRRDDLRVPIKMSVVVVGGG